MNFISVGIAMVSRFFFVFVGLFVAVFASAQEPQLPAAPPLPVIQPVDANRFFCSFACTPGACVASQAVFNRCKQCPQTQVSGCLMAASGVPVEAAKAAMNAGTLLPPPGSCPTPEGKGGKEASDEDGEDSHDGGDSAEGDDSEKGSDGGDSEAQSGNEGSDAGEEGASAGADDAVGGEEE